MNTGNENFCRYMKVQFELGILLRFLKNFKWKCELILIDGSQIKILK